RISEDAVLRRRVLTDTIRRDRNGRDTETRLERNGGNPTVAMERGHASGCDAAPCDASGAGGCSDAAYPARCLRPGPPGRYAALRDHSERHYASDAPSAHVLQSSRRVRRDAGRVFESAAVLRQ